MAGDQFALTSSSLIRQIFSLGGDVRVLSSVLPEVVIRRLVAMQPAAARPTSDLPLQ
jgi:hypothetical protein